jgi:hypothetical protein
LGGSLAYLLAQHKAELGTKYVTEIVIFRDNYPQDVHPCIQILFRIKDVPDPDVDLSQDLQIRSSVLEEGLENRIRVHKIFQGTNLLIIGSA